MDQVNALSLPTAPRAFGFFVDGGHGHCQIPDTQRPAIEAFVDRFLLGRDVATDIRVHPYPELEYQAWMPWATR